MKGLKMLKKLTVFTILGVTSWAVALDLYISPNGSDSNDGSKAKPVKTFARVQELLKNSNDKQKVVRIEDGEYFYNQGITLNGDSNNSVYQAINPGKVRIIGGQYVPANKFVKITDQSIYNRLPEKSRDQVLELDLTELNIKHTGPMQNLFGNLGQVGNGGIIDLYFEGERKSLARWPNQSYTTMQEVVESGEHRGKAGKFIYRGDRAKDWTKAVENGDLFLSGFWRVPWVCQSIKVGEINPEDKTITHIQGISGGIGSKYTPSVNGQRKGDGKELYYAFNLPEELDIPGEWYINSKTKKLYFYPPAKLSDNSVMLADLATPVLTIQNAENILIENLTFEGGLSENISIKDSKNITIAGCDIRRTGGMGIKIVGGSDCQVLSCNFYNNGAEAINVSGGDRKNLTPSNHKIINNHIYKFGEVVKISNAITVAGVGVYIGNNLMHDGNYGGVSYGGNDHVFEYNELHNLGLDGGDFGVFYANSDWASAGTMIRYNFGHHIKHGNFFYPDDGKSNDKAINNIAYKTSSGLFAGGGHNNQFLDNVVYEANTGLHIDDRGVPRKYDKRSRVHYKTYSEIAKGNQIYTDKYPGIQTIDDEKSIYPTGNTATGNFVINCKKDVNLSGKKENFSEVTVQDNVMTKTNVGFKNPAKLDFTLSNPNVQKGKLKWVNEHFPKIGLFKDKYRTKIEDNNERYDFKPIAKEFNSVDDMNASNQIEKK